MRTIYGLIRSFNSKRFWAPLGVVGVALISVLAGAVGDASAQVDPTTIFEVGDGNTAPNGTPNCDWDTLNDTYTADTNTPAVTCAGAGATLNAFGFLVGGTNEKNFQTGGSKDPLDTSNWKWTNSSTPDKDTLTHGYAASYTAVGGDKILVFGAERFAVNGDANIGIWFFQQAVRPNSSGGFDGLHTAGDIFAVSAFTGGGTNPTLDVYEWDPTCTASHYPSPAATGDCADTNLRKLFTGTGGQLCSGGPGCATVNGSPITPTWPYATKFGGGTTVPVNGFFEGGFDLTAILPPGSFAPCFSSFLLETRSSQSTSAVLKDFLSGNFPECHLSVTKTVTCNSFNADNTFNYSYSGQVINDGGGDLFNVQVLDKGVTYTCGTLSKGTSQTFPGPSCPQPGGTTNTFTTSVHPATNLATATAQTSSSGGTSLSASTGSVTSTDLSDTSCTPHPGLAVTKRCVTAFQATGSNVVVRVDYTGEVTNTGQLTLSNVNVTNDSGGGPFGAFSLTPGQSVCYSNGAATCPNLTVSTGLTTNPPQDAGAASYFPTSANVFGLTEGRIQFTDTVSATGTASNGTSVGPVTASAHCVICPFGSCAAQ